MARTVLATRRGGDTMAARDRATDEFEHEDETREVARDESGTRRRPYDELSEPFELDDDDELELLEELTPRPRVVPPPPPRTTQQRELYFDPRPPAPPRSTSREHVDLVSLAQVARSSMPLRPSATPRSATPAPMPVVTAPAMPPPLPRPYPPAPPSRPQWGIAIVVGTTGVVVGAITAAILLTSRGPAESGESVAEVEQTAEVARPTAIEPAPAPSLPRIPGQAEPVSLASEPEPAPAPEPAREIERGSERRVAPTRAPRPPVARREPPPEPAVAAPPSVDAAEEEEQVEEVEEVQVVEEASSEEPAAEEASEPVAELPELPARADVDAAVHAVMPALRACGQGLDLVNIELHFAPTGRATTANIDARHLTPAQRSCLARAARGARVPPFSAPRLTVRYPVRL